MSIQEIYINFKKFLNLEDTRLSALILCVGVASFALGRMSTDTQNGAFIESEPAVAEEVRFEEPIIPKARGSFEAATIQNLTVTEAVEEGGYVGSKNGTKYHLPWCSGAKRIKEENKVWFSTKEEAEKAGYSPASNCKGI